METKREMCVSYRMFIEGIFETLQSLKVIEFTPEIDELIEGAFHDAYRRGYADGQEKRDTQGSRGEVANA